MTRHRLKEALSYPNYPKFSEIKKRLEYLENEVAVLKEHQGGILTGEEIKKRLNKDIIIEPFNLENLNPNSVDLTLHDEIIRYESYKINLSEKKQSHETIKIPEEGFWIEPGQFYLGKTVEWTETYNIAPIISGKSSAGRVAFFTNCSAYLGDIGYKGHWSLQLYSPIYRIFVKPNIRIAHIAYLTVIGDIKEYNGHYQNSSIPIFASTSMGGNQKELVLGGVIYDK